MKHVIGCLLVAGMLILGGCIPYQYRYSQGPDLEIKPNDLLLYPLPLQINTPATIEAKVGNIGTGIAGEFKVGFYVNGEMINQPVLINNLDPGDAVIIKTAWTPTQQQRYRIEVKTDIFDQVTEQREYNNDRTVYEIAYWGEQSSTVSDVYSTDEMPAAASATSPPAAASPNQPQVEYSGEAAVAETPAVSETALPDLAIDLTDLSYSAAPQLGQRITLSAEITNGGTGDVSAPFQVIMYINGEPLATTATVNYLMPGESIMVNLPWMPDAEGWTEVKVVLDPDGVVNETATTNNSTKRNLYVRP